jgi:hypothetical protein
MPVQSFVRCQAIPEASEISQYECPTLNPSHVILDALYALGKTEDDFDWVQKPVILRMSTEIVDACYEFLRPKRKPRTINELYIPFVMKGYLLFTEDDLLKALLEDSRFVVEEADAGLFAEARVTRKTRTRRK